jgi:uncharacterized integral membrane protein
VDESTETEPRASATPAERRHRRRLIAASVISALAAAFAVVNFNDVKVHWLVTTDQTPLIVVIVLAFLFGMAADRLWVVRGRRKQR